MRTGRDEDGMASLCTAGNDGAWPVGNPGIGPACGTLLVGMLVVGTLVVGMLELGNEVDGACIPPSKLGPWLVGASL